MFVFSQRLTSSLRMILPVVVFTMLLSACSLTGPGEAASLSENSVTITVAANTASLPTVAPTTRSVSTAQPTTQAAQNSVPTAPNVACQLKTDWPTYIAQANDTLSGIATRAGTDTQTLAQANCLTNLNMISVGQTLYVPSVPAAVIAPPAAAVQNSFAADVCVARTTSSAALYSWYTGTGAYVVTQPPADVVLAVNEIGFNGYVSLTHNGATGWADPSSVALMGDCAGLIPAEYTGCLVWSPEDNNEFNILTAPEGTPIVMFPGRVWVLAYAYRPSRPNDSAYLGNQGWYKVRLTNGIEGWIPGFVERKLGNCAGLSSDA